MDRVKTRQLSDRISACPGCGQQARQHLVEVQIGSGLLSRLIPGRYTPVARSATCSACGDRYPVRADDTNTVAASHRATPRHGRDWGYPEVGRRGGRTAPAHLSRPSRQGAGARRG